MKCESPDSNRVSWETGWRTNGASEAAAKCVGAECHSLCLTVLSDILCKTVLKLSATEKKSMIQIVNSRSFSTYFEPNCASEEQKDSGNLRVSAQQVPALCGNDVFTAEVCSFYILSGLSDLIHTDLQYKRSLFGKRLPLRSVSGQRSDRGDHCEFHSSLGKTLEP